MVVAQRSLLGWGGESEQMRVRILELVSTTSRRVEKVSGVSLLEAVTKTKTHTYVTAWINSREVISFATKTTTKTHKQTSVI